MQVFLFEREFYRSVACNRTVNLHARLVFPLFSISEYWPILYKHNTLYFSVSLFPLSPSFPPSCSLSCILSPAILLPIGEMEAPAIAPLCFDLLTGAQLFANRFNNSAVD